MLFSNQLTEHPIYFSPNRIGYKVLTSSPEVGDPNISRVVAVGGVGVGVAGGI